MRLTAVAEAIGLRSTSVTYYFPRKEELAVACMESGFEIFHRLLEIAECEPDPKSRISRLIEEFVRREADVRRGRAMPLCSFASLRSMDGDHFQRLFAGYMDMFRRVRMLFGEAEEPGEERMSNSIRSIIMLEQLYWAHAWLEDCELEDYPRAAARMTDIIVGGLAAPGAKFEPVNVTLDTSDPDIDPSKEAFLRAATRQINAHGYRGASVDRISAALNLTKGAFYHHNEAKDDVVLQCFRRSFGIMAAARRIVRHRGKTEWTRLVSGVLALIRFQVGEDGPLLRTGILYSIPLEQRDAILESYDRVEWTIAGMISDAIAEGAIRPVDPNIASHLLVGAINAAEELRHWNTFDLKTAPAHYCRAMFMGLLAT